MATPNDFIYLKQITMKLYSEDNVKRAMAYSYLMGVERNPDYQPIEESILKEVEAIELPSDEEIEEESQNKTRVDFGYYLRITWLEGAKWMKEQILKQNVPELRNANGTYGSWGTSGGNGKSMTNQKK